MTLSLFFIQREKKETKPMNFYQIRECDVANGPGCRATIFVTGCNNHCEGCFNVKIQDFESGNRFTRADQERLFSAVRLPQISGLSVLGGEPLDPNNIMPVLALLTDFRKHVGWDKTIWLWTGYTYESEWFQSIKDSIMPLVDVIVDGPFVMALKNLSLQFRGSSNQRLIDCKKTLEAGKVVEWNG